jgi:hypothetical protein
MAFVLKPHKLVASQLRRLVAQELNDAITALSDPRRAQPSGSGWRGSSDWVGEM